MSKFDAEAFQSEMRKTAQNLLSAAQYCVIASGFTTVGAANIMLMDVESYAEKAHATLMAAKALINGAPCEAIAVEVRDGEEIPL